MGRRYACAAMASRMPDLQFPVLLLAAAYAQSDKLEEARAEAAETYCGSTPVSQFKDASVLPSEDPKDRRHVVMGCARRGCPRLEPQAPVFPVPKTPCRAPTLCSPARGFRLGKKMFCVALNNHTLILYYILIMMAPIVRLVIITEENPCNSLFRRQTFPV